MDDKVNAAYDLPHNYRISKVSGIHIVIDRALVPDCMFLQTDNRRIFFMIPWGRAGRLSVQQQRPRTVLVLRSSDQNEPQLNIPVRRSRSSGDLETACPELGNRTL